MKPIGILLSEKKEKTLPSGLEVWSCEKTSSLRRKGNVLSVWHPGKCQEREDWIEIEEKLEMLE